MKKKTVMACCAASLVLSLLFGAFSILPVRSFAQNGDKQSEVLLVPGGTPFGVRFRTDGAVIFHVKEGSPAGSAGLTAGDVVVGVNAETVHSGSDLQRLLRAGKGEKTVLRVARGRKTWKLAVVPDENGEIGVHVRDSLAGIGTLSFFEPQSGRFAGLGHGICETHSKELLPLGEGSLSAVRLIGIVRGSPGAPGQLRGIFCPGTTGKLTSNEEEGIFGTLDEPPAGEALPAAKAEELREGRAVIRCTVTDGRTDDYEIEIERIISTDSSGKNFLLRVTDQRLIEQTGGIVQGMSGSPIIQNGRIVGAVTHVLLEDPERGYGIFVGNMLKKMEKR